MVVITCSPYRLHPPFSRRDESCFSEARRERERPPTFVWHSVHLSSRRINSAGSFGRLIACIDTGGRFAEIPLLRVCNFEVRMMMALKYRAVRALPFDSMTRSAATLKVRP